MSNFDPDGGAGEEWNERGDLAWNEFDWERYLREQDESIHRYLGFYEAAKSDPDRIDAVAELMGWGEAEWTEEDGATETSETKSEAEQPADFSEEEDEAVYTLHTNP